MSKTSQRRPGEGYAEGWERVFGKDRQAVEIIDYDWSIGTDQNVQGDYSIVGPSPMFELPQRKTCQHCKHWAKEGFFRRCENLEIEGMLNSDDWRSFEPPANFGCTLFEAKT